MDSENEEILRERAQNLERLVRGPLASSIEKLRNSARNIPLETDFHFYNNFPHFKQPIIDLKKRSESLLREIGTSRSLWKRPSSFPADPDDAYDWVVTTQDDIFERVDVSMDEFRQEQKGCKPGGLNDLDSGFQLVYGNRKKCWTNRREVGVSKTVVSRPESGSPSVKVVSRNKKTTSRRCRVPFHLPNISRPQDRYNIVVDNSNTPFKHRGLQKTEDGSKYVHPLEAEPNKMEFAVVQSEAPAPLEPCPWESTPFKFVERVQDLKEMVIKLQSASEIAVDLEHNQYRSYQGLTCLMQISTRLEDFVVDTLILRNHIGPCLKDIFSNPFIRKVMHGADRDILWLQCDFGIYVCNLFDTGQASRVLQLERNSLEFLLKHYCGITADKQYQTADWRLRPLPPEMIKYAREDTHYLLYIHDVMWQKLASIRLESGEAPLLEVYRHSRDICLQLYEKECLTETSYLHVYGLQEENFSPEQLAVVAGLYEWRDGIARTEDESTGYILPNKVLLQIAKRMPKSLDELRAFVTGRHSLVECNLAAVLDVINKARETGKRAIAEKLPLKALAEGTYEEMPQVGDRHPTVSVDTTAANIESYSQTYDNNVLSSDRLDMEAKAGCKNSVDIEVTNDRNSFFKEANRGETEFSEKAVSHNERQTYVVVGRAASSLLFNKKRDSVNGARPISNDTKSNLVCQSLLTHPLPRPSKNGVSNERCAEGNFVKENGDAKQAEDFQVIIPVDCSNSVDFISKESSTSGQTSLKFNFAAQEDDTVDKNTELSEAREPLVQAQKRPGWGLAAMLGSSKSKLKIETSSKVHDPEQDNARNKVEKIKASITLPFQPFHVACEPTSIQHSPKSKEDLTNKSSQVDEVGEVLCTETANSSVEIEIENAILILKKSDGIVHSEEGKKHRAWWPSVQFEGVGKASATTEKNIRELPPSLSELRQRQNYRHLSSCKLLQSANDEAHANVNDFLRGENRKSHSSEPSSASKVSSVVPEMESQFKPFDYAAARQSMHFEMSDILARNVKGHANNNVSRKKGKGFVHEPVGRAARESSADDIQPGKRRQVFPASGNRSATFR